MDFRRINDLLKIAGAFGAAITIIAPALSMPHKNFGELIANIAPFFTSAIAAFAAGLGTRGFGQEDKKVVEAQTIAKIAVEPTPLPGGRISIRPIGAVVALENTEEPLEPDEEALKAALAPAATPSTK